MTSNWARNANKLTKDITQPYYIGSLQFLPYSTFQKEYCKKKFQISN